MKTHIFKWIPIIFFALTALAVMSGIFGRTPLLLIIYVTSILLLYANTIYIVIYDLEATGKYDTFLAIGAFLVISIVLIISFAIAWAFFGLFIPSAPSPFVSYDASFCNSFYFSTTVFSTLGFGDYIPFTQSGRMLSSVEAILGTVHTVTYFSLIMRNFK
jgi:hypothetical protein